MPAPAKNKNAAKDETLDKSFLVKCSLEEFEYWTSLAKKEKVSRNAWVRSFLPTPTKKRKR